MKAFFDTGVTINTFFKAVLPRAEFEKFFSLYDIFVCPVVKHELLLGTIHPKTKAALSRFFDQCPACDAPSRELWGKMTEIMKQLRWRENRQQNDVLIALTAEQENASLITYDARFESLKGLVDFELVLLGEKQQTE